MSVSRINGALPVLFALAIVLPFLQAGCGDDTRTTGTQLKMSEQAKQQIKDMRESYKQNKALRKEENKALRKTR